MQQTSFWRQSCIFWRLAAWYWGKKSIIISEIWSSNHNINESFQTGCSQINDRRSAAINSIQLWHITWKSQASIILPPEPFDGSCPSVLLRMGSTRNALMQDVRHPVACICVWSNRIFAVGIPQAGMREMTCFSHTCAAFSTKILSYQYHFIWSSTPEPHRIQVLQAFIHRVQALILSIGSWPNHQIIPVLKHYIGGVAMIFAIKIIEQKMFSPEWLEKKCLWL